MSSKRYFALVMIIGAATALAGCRNQSQQFGTFQQPFQQQVPNPYLNYNVPGAAGSGTQPVFGQPTGSGTQTLFGQPAGSGTQVPFTQPAPTSGSFTKSTLIPPPATGTLQIPSLARNNPFGINQNGGLLNTNQAAPTAASNRSARFNVQNGWHPADDRRTNFQNPQNTQPNTSTTLGSNTAPVGTGVNRNPVTSPASATSVLARTQAPVDRGYGDSFVRSQDYSSTVVNEIQDGTRLPAVDASGIRAPSQFYARASGVQVAQTPQQAVVAQAQPYYSGTFRTAQQSPYNVPTIQPIQSRGVFVANNNAFVQDQSTATYDPYGNTRSADWRNRDVTSGTFQ